jgi:hypothetical protein
MKLAIIARVGKGFVHVLPGREGMINTFEAHDH